MSYYDQVYDGGDSSSGSQWATIHLYPKSGLEETAKRGGIVATALRNAMDELISAGAMDYYEILRFKTGQYKAPDGINPTDGTDVDFKDYLKGDNDNFSDYENGTGDNLYSRVGVHHLIHEDQNACDEDSENYAPAGANAEGRSESAFSQGLVSWAPVCEYNDGLTRNAAVQEPLHMLINPSYDDGWTGAQDDQHSLGKVISYNTDDIVTPMLTYHWDDPKDKVGEGDCPSTDDNRYANSHTELPTYCSEKATQKTADEEIPSTL